MGTAYSIGAFLALLALPACSEPNTITADERQDPQENQLAEAAPVTLPPSIRENKTYRCKDNSLVYVTFMNDGLTALVRDKQEEPPLATLKAESAGKPFVAEEGFSLSGSGDTVSYSSPDSGTLSCKA